MYGWGYLEETHEKFKLNDKYENIRWLKFQKMKPKLVSVAALCICWSHDPWCAYFFVYF